jgi:hypothetical protein
MNDDEHGSGIRNIPPDILEAFFDRRSTFTTPRRNPWPH